MILAREGTTVTVKCLTIEEAGLCTFVHGVLRTPCTERGRFEVQHESLVASRVCDVHVGVDVLAQFEADRCETLPAETPEIPF